MTRFSLTTRLLLECCTPARRVPNLTHKSEQLLHSFALIIRVEWSQDPNLGHFLSKEAEVPTWLVTKQGLKWDHNVLVTSASLSLALFPNLLPILMFCVSVHYFHINTTKRRGGWGFSLETYLQWAGSPNRALHEESTPHRGLTTERRSPLFLQSLLGSESHRHHQSSQRYKKKARAGAEFEAAGGRDSRAHLVPRQRGSKRIGNSSDTCGCEAQEWVRCAPIVSRSFGARPHSCKPCGHLQRWLPHHALPVLSFWLS